MNPQLQRAIELLNQATQLIATAEIPNFDKSNLKNKPLKDYSIRGLSRRLHTILKHGNAEDEEEIGTIVRLLHEKGYLKSNYNYSATKEWYIKNHKKYLIP